jgi:hypothetical protein
VFQWSEVGKIGSEYACTQLSLVSDAAVQNEAWRSSVFSGKIGVPEKEDVLAASELWFTRTGNRQLPDGLPAG